MRDTPEKNGNEAMRKELHLLISTILFCIFSIPVLLFTPITLGMAFWALLAAALGSIFPDIIEPAHHWQHRSFFHGTAILRLCVILFIITGLVSFLSVISSLFYYFYLLSGFFLGYASHLIADSTTKMGIPETRLPVWATSSLNTLMERFEKTPGHDIKLPGENKQRAGILDEIGDNRYGERDSPAPLKNYRENLKVDPTSPNRKLGLVERNKGEKEGKNE